MSEVSPDDQTVTPAASQAGFRFSAGTLFAGRYRLVRPLARGGMGEVYEVEDTQLGEVVALKTLDARLAGDPVALARFQGEVKSARRVSHPNVCRLFDFGTHREGEHDVPFLTMELLAGETLEARLRRGRPAREELLEVLQQVASALDAAHEMGVVHRDLKPSNVMLVQYSGGGTRAVVTDFGIARRVDEATVTKDGWVGTPAYIAPEQLEGKKVSPAADVYALGVMAFECATGKLPFEGTSAIEVAMQRLARAAPRAREVAPELPAAWDDAIARCLERAPERRWEKATDALSAMGARQTLEARRVPATPRRRAVLTGLALAIAAALAVGAWAFLRSPLPAEGRVVALVVTLDEGATPVTMPAGFPSFEEAIADVMRRKWRLLEVPRRFRIATGAEGNVTAHLRWRRVEKVGLSGVLELRAGERLLRRAEASAGNAADLAAQLYPALSELVGEGQRGVELWPEELAESRILNAPSPEAYREFIELYDRAWEAVTIDAEPLDVRIKALVERYPTWAHAVALLAAQHGTTSEEGRALARERLALPQTERDDPSGAEILRGIIDRRVPTSLVRSDRSAALVAMTGLLDPEETLAQQREMTEVWPQLQWGSALTNVYLSEGKLELASKELQAWMGRAPGQRDAWITFSRLELAQGRPPAPIELLITPDPALTTSLAYLWLHSGDLERASDLAGRLVSGSPRFRAVAHYLLGLIAILRGQLSQAADRLSRAWTLAEGEVLGINFWWTQAAREGRRVAELRHREDEARFWRKRELETFQRFGWPASLIAALSWATRAEGEKCPDRKPFIEAAPELARSDARRFITRAATAAGCGTCDEVLALGPSLAHERMLPWTSEYLRCVNESSDVQAALAVARPSVDLALTAITNTLDASVCDTVLARYWYARLLEKNGDAPGAKAQLQSFLGAWGKADFQSPEVDDARKRLAALP